MTPAALKEGRERGRMPGGLDKYRALPSEGYSMVANERKDQGEAKENSFFDSAQAYLTCVNGHALL
jgi:hypothetical protein